MKAKPSPERLEARMSAEQKEKFKLAAQLQGLTLTDFVIQSANTEADKVISEHNIIQLSIKESQHFFDILTNVPNPNATLVEASKKYRQFKKQQHDD